MKKLLLLVLIIFIIPLALADPSISIDMPREVEKGTSFKVILTIDTDSEDKFDIAVFIPEDWEIVDWDITPKLGVDFETSAQEFLGEEHNMNHWKFNSVSDEIVIEYTVDAKNIGKYEFITLWMCPSGFDYISNKIEVVAPKVEEHSSSSTSSITGFVVKEIESKEPTLTQENNAKSPIEVLNIETAKNALSKIKNIVFNIPY